MSDAKSYIQKLLEANSIGIGPNKRALFEAFASNRENIEKVTIIQQNQNEMIDKYKIMNRIDDIMQHPVQIPNGTVGKVYESKFDFIKLGWNDVIFSEFEGLEDYGLHYDNQSELISGTPTQNGEFKIKLKFRVTGEAEDSVLNEKLINLIINADPKSLWKNLESDKTDKFWKPDNVSEFKPIGNRHIVVSSKRGRSHANVGSFRDDDYAFGHLEDTGWSIVAVSDGAGSAKASRKGSEIACKEVVDYFKANLTKEVSSQFDALLKDFNNESNGTTENVASVPSPNVDAATETAVVEVETTKHKIGKFIYNNLGGCAKSVYNKLEDFALKNEINIKELHSTLIFTLFRKYDFGYVLLTFGVGDCPIGVLNKDKTDFKLMNWLDVGEFGGGTRFITMPEIFVSDKFSTRFGFKIIDDFSYLMLMTDGIYDAKFVVEANLEKLEKWKEFIADLEGNNEDKAKVVFDKNNTEIANQLSEWMDFWSPGNHDDRTLAVIF